LAALYFTLLLVFKEREKENKGTALYTIQKGRIF
jgi:hypothetical protein